MVDWIDASRLIGGLGLFLLGLTLLTDGLRHLAAERVRRWLTRFTGRPSRALLTGAAATAIVQSSTATTLSTIGMVSAGLLTFQQSLGVIYGANLGTTSTAWLVAALGLRFSLSLAAYPIVAIGAALRLLGRDRSQAIGSATAGFGLLFIGIDLLQAGMASAAAAFDPAALAPQGIPGRLLLVLIGILITIVLQSSSSAVAASLAALHAGAITLEQAAALVIGQNIGTTFTALLAGLGSAPAAQRTAAAHIGFNLGTGILAFFLVPLLVHAATIALDVSQPNDAALALAAFHTGFNLIGVLLFLPLTTRYARLIERLIPDRGPDYARHLDASVARVPAVAVEASRRAVGEILQELIRLGRTRLDGTRLPRDAAGRLDRAEEGLRQTHEFLSQALDTTEARPEQARHLSVIHALDHARRMHHTLRDTVHAECFSDSPDLAEFRTQTRDALNAAETWLRTAFPSGDLRPTAALLQPIPDRRRDLRHNVLRRVAQRDVASARADNQLEALSWAESLARHLNRALHHLTEPPPADGAPPTTPA